MHSHDTRVSHPAHTTATALKTAEVVPIEDIATWYAARDVARELDLSYVWIAELIRRGEFRAIKTRLGWLMDPASVRQYAQAHPKKTEPTAC